MLVVHKFFGLLLSIYNTIPLYIIYLLCTKQPIIDTYVITFYACLVLLIVNILYHIFKKRSLKNILVNMGFLNIVTITYCGNLSVLCAAYLKWLFIFTYQVIKIKIDYFSVSNCIAICLLSLLFYIHLRGLYKYIILAYIGSIPLNFLHVLNNDNILYKEGQGAGNHHNQ